MTDSCIQLYTGIIARERIRVNMVFTKSRQNPIKREPRKSHAAIKIDVYSQGQDGFPSARIGWDIVFLESFFMVSFTAFIASVGQIFRQNSWSQFGTAWSHFVVNQNKNNSKAHARVVSLGG